MTSWYINRAAGLVAWALLTASVILGLLLSSKVLGKKVKPNWLQDLHRGISGLSAAFVAVHVAGAIGDNYIHFGLKDVLVPGASSWRPLAMAWGVVTTYLLIAVEGSSLLRKHLPKTLWRKLHYLSFPLFITATAHGISAGTDGGKTVGVAVAALAASAIAGLTAMRVVDELDKKANPAPPRVPAVRTAPAPEPVVYAPHTYSVAAPVTSQTGSHF